MNAINRSELGSLKVQFETIPDHRSTINRRHILSEICVMAIAAIIAGDDGPTDIRIWSKERQAWLVLYRSLGFG